MLLTLVVLGLAVVLGVAVLVYRRKYFSQKQERTETFTLDDLRQMRRQGQISEEEFHRMREAVIGISLADAAQAQSEEEG